MHPVASLVAGLLAGPDRTGAPIDVSWNILADALEEEGEFAVAKLYREWIWLPFPPISGTTDGLALRSSWFALARRPVTQEEYANVTGKNPSYFCGTRGWKERFDPIDTRRFPVDSVSWTDARNYCRQWTKTLANQGFLPTHWRLGLPDEPRWEFACRAGSNAATAFGDALSSRQANFDGRHPLNDAEPGPFLRRTVNVGAYPPNGWGFFDMHGNVNEWCDRREHPHVPASQAPLRGGSWADPGSQCASDFRRSADVNSRSPKNGFRLALFPDP